MNSDQTPRWQPEKGAALCAEISGFLFQHPCGMHARHHCYRCEKPICVAHTVTQGEQTICQSCSKLPPDQPTPTTKDWLAGDYWHDIDVEIDDRPVWYRRKSGIRKSRLKKNRHHHSSEPDMDFTDADESEFDTPESNQIFAEQPWENDMGAS